MDATELRLALPDLPPALSDLRAQVRHFVADGRASGVLPLPEKVGLGFSIEATRAIAAQGWIA